MQRVRMKFGVRFLVAFFIFIQGCDETNPVTPLMTDCSLPMNHRSLAIGLGKDHFASIETIENALIVGGYQGGHHLWGAFQLPDDVSLESVSRLQALACIDGTIAAAALYQQVASLPHAEGNVFGIPVVFDYTFDVAMLDGVRTQLLIAVETDGAIYADQDSAPLRCCGHVADGD